MEKNVKYVEKIFYLQTATICSNECFLSWIKTEEFDTELCEALGITKEKKDEESNNI
jgi:hypothetical protein